MLATLLLTIPAATQGVRVIYPDPAMVAAARLPVPEVIMTRAEADAMPDAELTRRLIGHVAHGPITRVRRQAVDRSPPGPVAEALTWAAFSEAGTPWRGRLCRGRDIQVTFSAVEGADRAGAPNPPAEERPAEDRPQRVFAVTQYRTMAIVPTSASSGACSRASMARVPPGHVDQAAGLVEQLLAATGGTEGGPTLGACFDRYASGAMRCDARATLRSLDWSQLIAVSRTDFTGEPVRWTIMVGPSGRSWNVVVEETDAAPLVTLRRGHPAPF